MAEHADNYIVMTRISLIRIESSRKNTEKQLEMKCKYNNWSSLFFNLYDVMKIVVVAKILHEALRAS